MSQQLGVVGLSDQAQLYLKEEKAGSSVYLFIYLFIYLDMKKFSLVLLTCSILLVIITSN